jgi:RNA polymerase sigma-70 factor (ECF subfamily)
MADQVNPEFHTTRWTVVLSAGRTDEPDSRDALSSLCATYWYPLYAFARRRGHDRHGAEDLTQGFFTALLEKNYVGAVDPARGRFRAFLLTAFKRYLGKERDRDHAQKRGGGKAILSMDFEDGEKRYRMEPAHETTPERIFDRRWALLLIEQTLDRLRSEMDGSGKTELFNAFRPLLKVESDPPAYKDLAERLDMTEGAVKTAVHRMRARYRDLLRAEIAGTVSNPGEVDLEIRHLLEALRV